MNESIPVSIPRIIQLISTLPPERFSTADVLRAYLGAFCANLGTPPAYSFNAQFGMLLKRNDTILQIEEIETGVAITDDYGNQTSTSYWRTASEVRQLPETAA